MKFFGQRCQPISNNSILPLEPAYYANNRLDANFNFNKIEEVIQSLVPNKAIGCDCVFARILKLSRPSITKPLLIIFRNNLTSGTF